MNKVDGVYHRWQRSIPGVSCKDTVPEEEGRARTGQHIQRKTTSLACSCGTNELPTPHTTAGVILGGSRNQERMARSTENKL